MKLYHIHIFLMLLSRTKCCDAKVKETKKNVRRNVRRKTQDESKKPNILIILADDVGTSDIPYWGDNIVPMNNIQKLQSQGVTFMHAHASPLCAPSRYMLLSGNYPHRGYQKGGAWNFSAEQNQFIGDQKSIAEVLKDQFNYHTGMYGKWHLGGRVPDGGTYSNDRSRPLTCCDIDWEKPMEDGPNSIGFDESFYTMGGIQSAPYSFFRNEYLQTDVNNIKFWEEGTHTTVNNNGESIIGKEGEGDPEWDSTEYNVRLVKEVDDFLENHNTTDPFFLYVGLGQVHTPHSPPKFYTDGTPIAGTFEDPHLDLLYEMDLVVGSLMASVEDRGLMENTLVIFTSDNGSVWEGGYTIPMIMRYDGIIPTGENKTGLVGINDIYATLADFVGFDIPDGSAQDSISFADHAKSEGKASNRDFFGVWNWAGRVNSQAIRYGKYKYAMVFNDKNDEYLYDLSNDVREKRNLLRQSSDSVDELKIQMSTELRRLGFCPLDVEESFVIPYGPDRGKEVTCQYFKEDKTRCRSVHIGELNCNSICGRNNNLCMLYPKSSQCRDDHSFEFIRENGDTGTCGWLSERAFRKEKYCGRTEISNGCMATCKKCSKNILNTSVPSQPPYTSAPSQLLYTSVPSQPPYTSVPSQPPTSCWNKKQYKFPTHSGEKSCKWLCFKGKKRKIKRRQARYCKGDVSLSCCQACNAGPRCT
ncbi:hypothetical protein CTEN210_06544 [Chaetoceros tenuissimus]|uniref:Sulfatase N-terminal domain-containing protein n=1 Tax=Chaetoceros tenuissimus TaxID=426638 RepID=A0AAD3CQK5_9STRA|nr:hypothetical protein CTEN210_06544 [Chaetoceros tenuissimus]